VLSTACGSELSGPTSGSATVAGSVNRLKTGDGVANLVVALLQDHRVVQAAPTDAGGRFAFTDVPPGTYTARLTGLELAGVQPRFTAFDPPERELTVGVADMPDVTFAAVGLFTQVHTMVSCGGAPAAGVGVRVVGGGTDVTTTTNGAGEIVVQVDPGSYTVFVTGAPCALPQSYSVVHVNQGQTAQAEFSG